MTPTTAAAIADYFIYIANGSGSYITNKKLQKLVYYAQAWYLAIYGTPLFQEDFQAWVHGPAIPSLYQEYKVCGWNRIQKDVEKPNFSENLQRFLEKVTEMYFSFDAYTLEKMTHQESPWIDARGNLPRDVRSNAIISKESMRNYYKANISRITSSIRLSDLATMPEQERKERVDKLFQAAFHPTNEQLREQMQELDRRIASFERRYEMSSDQMMQQLESHQLRETADICSWLMLIRMKRSALESQFR